MLERRTDLRALQLTLPLAPVESPPTCFGAMCWGAGRQYEEAGNGEGLVPRPCQACAGTGSVLAAPPGPC
jgi:hypothetical protein